MPNDYERVRVGLDVDAGVRQQREDELPLIEDADPESAFRIGVLADFSGRASRGSRATGRELAERKPLLVDRDNLDDVMRRLDLRLRLELVPGMGPLEIRFASLDDFHPDRLIDAVPMFKELRAAQLRASAGSSVSPVKQKPAPPAAPANLLDSMLGEGPLPPGGAALATPPSVPVTSYRRETDGGLDEFVERAVAPHLAPEEDPLAADTDARIEAAREALMRVLLHHPDFQALESAWRSVDFLVRRLETDGALSVELIDISKEELAADLDGTQPGAATSLRRMLVDRTSGTAGGKRWSVLIGCYSFGMDDADFDVLARLGEIVASGGAVLIAGASTRLVGTRDIVKDPDPDDWTDAAPSEWQRLRRLPQAAHLGLVLPRFLLRLPYGKETDPCEQLNFEELDPGAPPEHESYLWGNGAVICALILGERFTEQRGASRQIDGLPLHVWRADGEATATPCSEILLTERGAERVLDAGIMPLVSVKDSDAVILVREQSIAMPPSRLAGRW
jgi:type VI secretion system protein ImpC